MKANILNDVSILSTISDKTLSKLTNIYIYAINEAIEESLLVDDKLVELDIGLGTITLAYTDDELKFRFTPNAKLKESIKDTIINKQNILEVLIENTLVDRITNRYKDLI